MSSIWISLGLLYLLQDSVSSDAVVSLTCPETKPVQSVQTVTVSCSITWKTNGSCNVTKSWIHTNGTITECGITSGMYRCAWDNSNVNLTIVGVKEDNITVEIHSNCGLDSDRIQVHVDDTLLTTPKSPLEVNQEKEAPLYLVPSILGVLAIIIVVTIVFIIKHCKTQNRKSPENDATQGCSEILLKSP